MFILKLFLSKFFLKMLSIFLIFILLFAFYFKIDNFLLNRTQIKNIEIKGVSYGLLLVLENQLNYLKQQSLKDIDIYSLKQELLKNSWIKNISITKRYPYTLEINVIEKNTYFLWQDDTGNFFVVDSNNNLIRKALEQDFRLININKGEIALKKSNELRYLLSKNLYLMDKIKSIDYQGYHFNITLKNNILIKLSESNLKSNIYQLLNLNSQYNLLNRKIDYIDLRLPNKIFIMPKYLTIDNYKTNP
jgi:cell division protein FtsQ